MPTTPVSNPGDIYGAAFWHYDASAGTIDVTFPSTVGEHYFFSWDDPGFLASAVSSGGVVATSSFTTLRITGVTGPVGRRFRVHVNHTVSTTDVVAANIFKVGTSSSVGTRLYWIRWDYDYDSAPTQFFMSFLPDKPHHYKLRWDGRNDALGGTDNAIGASFGPGTYATEIDISVTIPSPVLYDGNLISLIDTDTNEYVACRVMRAVSASSDSFHASFYSGGFPGSPTHYIVAGYDQISNLGTSGTIWTKDPWTVFSSGTGCYPIGYANGITSGPAIFAMACDDLGNLYVLTYDIFSSAHPYGQLLKIDPDTGAILSTLNLTSSSNPFGPVVNGSGSTIGWPMTDMDFDRLGNLWGLIPNNTAPGNIGTFDPATGVFTTVYTDSVTGAADFGFDRNTPAPSLPANCLGWIVRSATNFPIYKVQASPPIFYKNVSVGMFPQQLGGTCFNRVKWGYSKSKFGGLVYDLRLLTPSILVRTNSDGSTYTDLTPTYEDCAFLASAWLPYTFEIPTNILSRFLSGGWARLTKDELKMYYDGMWHTPCDGPKTLWFFEGGTWQKFNC